MSRIRSKDTRPELAVRRALYSQGVRYRVHVADLPGKPDIAIKKHKLVIEVKGCFWHGHMNCLDGHIPKTNSNFWKNKITKNQERDEKNKEKLELLGYSVHYIWECEVKQQRNLNNFIKKIVEYLSTK